MTINADKRNQQNFSAAPTANLADSNGGGVASPAVRLPVGYQFVPTDEELIRDFLMKKVNGEQLTPNPIREVNLYKKHPSQLTRGYKSILKTWYFFTSRDKKYPNGRRPNRLTGKGVGFWKATGKQEAIPKGGNSQIIGYKMNLDYLEGNRISSKKTDWKMHEYKVKPSSIKSKIKLKNDTTLDDWVLCKIYKKRIRRGSKNDVEEEEEEDDDDDDEASLFVAGDFPEDLGTEEEKFCLASSAQMEPMHNANHLHTLMYDYHLPGSMHLPQLISHKPYNVGNVGLGFGLMQQEQMGLHYADQWFRNQYLTDAYPPPSHQGINGGALLTSDPFQHVDYIQTNPKDIVPGFQNPNNASYHQVAVNGGVPDFMNGYSNMTAHHHALQYSNASDHNFQQDYRGAVSMDRCNDIIAFENRKLGAAQPDFVFEDHHHQAFGNNNLVLEDRNSGATRPVIVSGDGNADAIQPQDNNDHKDSNNPSSTQPSEDIWSAATQATDGPDLKELEGYMFPEINPSFFEGLEFL